MHKKLFWSAVSLAFALLAIIVVIVLVNSRPPVIQAGEKVPGPPEFPRPHDTTIMTYRAFENLQLEKTNLTSQQKMRNTGSFANSFGVGFIGLRNLSECDTCDLSIVMTEKSQEVQKYYLQLPGYKWKDYSDEFYVRNGKNYLQYMIWQEQQDGSPGADSRFGTRAYKELPFRFATDKMGEVPLPKAGQVLIPVSGSVYKLLRIPMYMLFAVLTVILILISFSIPGRILLRISRGEVFTQENVQQLKWIGWIILLFPLAILLVKIILRLAFSRFITSDVQLAIWDSLSDSIWTFVVGVIVLVIAKAFKRGFSLQQDQDLTI